MSSSMLHERLEELQHKASALEEEKVRLTMELAPLQGKLKAAEKAWQSEREALEERAVAAESALSECREQIQALEAERSSIAKENSSIHSDFRRLKREAEEKHVKVVEVWLP